MDMPQIMFYLLIKNFNEDLIPLLGNKIKEKLPEKSSVTFSSFEQYDKIPELTQCFFKIYSDEQICVEDIEKAYSLDWAGSYDTPAYFSKNRINCLAWSDTAIWDKRTDNKIFLHENVVWAHIYNNLVDLDKTYAPNEDEA